VEAASDASTPLLYVLRDEFALNGAKYGCGLGQCGSCTVMVDGEAVLSCLMPLLTVEGREVTTVEGGQRSGAGTSSRFVWARDQARATLSPPSAVVHSQPDRRLLRIGPRHPMPDVGRDEDVVTWPVASSWDELSAQDPIYAVSPR
jgi:hypothetical protein